MKVNSKRVLWDNVVTLMKKKYGGENLTRLALDAKFGPGTSTRLKKQVTSIGVDVIEKLAVVFELQPWQLLVPNLDPEAPPLLGGPDGWPFPRLDRRRFDQLEAEDKVELQGALRERIEKLEADAIHRQLRQAEGPKPKPRKVSNQ